MRLSANNNASSAISVANFFISFCSPVEVEDELLEAASQEGIISLPFGSGHLVDSEHGPGVNGRVDVIKGELVGGDLPVRSHVPLSQEEDQLLLRKLWVNFGKGDHVEGKIP